ncbi:MAG: WYL domain-containing protein [Bacteroidaceae bacterium]|nr:WYL domain-containing protein [Bacteroidaceae bacterium]
MSEQKSASRLIWVMSLLKNNNSKTVEVIASRVGISVRSAYRCIRTLQDQGINVTRRYGSVYTIDDEAEDLRKIRATLEPEKPEDGIILQKPCQDLKKASDTYEVLELMVKEHKLDDAPYLRQAVANVTLLQKAAQHRCKVTVDYDSNTEGRRIRKVLEPYTFYFYYNYVWAFDCEKERNIPLRISRMGRVKITEQRCDHGRRHMKQKIDAFGCYGHQTKHVKLRLTMQARNLMTEAHPISMITMKEDPEYPDGERWIVDLDVCEYSGLTRYIMGMLDEVEILEGEGLKEYIREWREKINAVVL